MVKTVPRPGHEVSSLSSPLTPLALDAAGKWCLNRYRYIAAVGPTQLISNPVVYLCYEQANHHTSSFEHRSHRDTLPQGQRPSGAKPLANHLATGPGQDD